MVVFVFGMVYLVNPPAPNVVPLPLNVKPAAAYESEPIPSKAENATKVSGRVVLNEAVRLLLAPSPTWVLSVGGVPPEMGTFQTFIVVKLFALLLNAAETTLEALA